jgi:hypothetical protein
MRLNWQPHYLFPKDISQAHHNGYSILWARTPEGRFMLISSKYEVSPAPSGEGDIERFDSREEMISAIT